MNGIAPVVGYFDSVNSSAALPTASATSALYEMTVAEAESRYAGVWGVNVATPALVPYVAPVVPPTLAEQAAALIAGGITITSTGTPALDGVYACNAAAQQNLQAVQTYILTNAKFPGSAGTYPWLDAAGEAHIFPTPVEFEAFSTAVANFVADCTLIMLTGTGPLPPATATIP